MFEITHEDLRKLGRQGGATARLNDGSIYTITPFGAKSVLKVKAIIENKQYLVVQEKSFSEIFSEIRTIKQEEKVIARSKNGVLLSTGRGYKRDIDKKDKFKGALK